MSTPDGDRIHYCTYFDRHFVTRGLALYRSLVRHSRPFTLWVLCFDAEAHEALTRLALPGIRPISETALEETDEPLRRAKATRSRIEYYFTCSPALPLYVFGQDPAIRRVIYLDADLYFYNDPGPIEAELDDASVLVVEHRFPSHQQDRLRWGRFNVGLVGFRRDDVGLACLQDWRERCLDWCHDRLEEDRYADQKYLDAWPARFSGVSVLSHRGAGLAPWNLETYPIELADGCVQVGGDPLIFYHFQGLRIVNRWLYSSGLAERGHRLTPTLRKHVYLPYAQELRRASELLADHGLPDSGMRGVRYSATTLRSLAGLALRGSLIVAGRGRAA